MEKIQLKVANGKIIYFEKLTEEAFEDLLIRNSADCYGAANQIYENIKSCESCIDEETGELIYILPINLFLKNEKDYIMYKKSNELYEPIGILSQEEHQLLFKENSLIKKIIEKIFRRPSSSLVSVQNFLTNKI